MNPLQGPRSDLGACKAVAPTRTGTRGPRHEPQPDSQSLIYAVPGEGGRGVGWFGPTGAFHKADTPRRRPHGIRQWP